MLKILRYGFSQSNQLRLIFQKLQKIDKSYQELQKLAISGNCTEQQRSLINDMESKIDIYRKMKSTQEVLDDLERLLKSNEEEDRQFAEVEHKKELAILYEYQQEALSFLIPPDEFDDISSIKLEVRPGVGGSEGSLFAEDVLNMYQSYCETQRWNCKLIHHQKDTAIGRGCKIGVLQIDGLDTYKMLKCESGVHKVIRVPETEKSGRLHSSTVTVAVLPNLKEEFVLDERELRIDFMRAQGAGGQHVNKTDSACRITHIPTGIQVVNQDERSQDKNKASAMRQIREKLFSLHVHEKQARMASRRKSQIASSDRSDKIRTYNYPQDRITDHRTNITLFGIEKMMQGMLVQELIDAMLDKIHAVKLTDLLEDLEQEA